MENNIKEKIFTRICDYQKIRDLATDSPKIANLAHDEMVISFLELLIKFDGIEFLKMKTERNEVLDKVKMFIASLLLPIDENFALYLIKKLTISSEEGVALSCKNILSEKYRSRSVVKLGISKIIFDMAKKKRIHLPENFIKL